MSAAYTGPCVADWGPRSVRVFTADGDARPVAVIRAADQGSVDDLLRAYGWKRIGPWSRTDDMPAGHKVAAVERASSDPTLDVLDRDQADGRLRRVDNTPLGEDR